MNNNKYIIYEGNEYTVFNIEYKKNNLPVLLDSDDFDTILKMKL